MGDHLVLPQFLRNDVLSEHFGVDADTFGQAGLSPHSVGELAGIKSAAGVADQMLSDPNVLEATLKSIGLPEDQVQIVMAQAQESGQLVEKTTSDPVVLLQPYVAPTDFAAQYPQPLDPTEILTLCEETSVYQALPEVVTPLNADYWREMDELEFDATGEAAQGFFLKGGCPDTTEHDGDNRTVTRMYLGAQKTLSYEDIKHSAAVAGMQGVGISAISTQQRRAAVSDVKAKEMMLQEIAVMNKWDRALVKGNSGLNALAFDGIEIMATAANGVRVNTDPTGTYDIEDFDNFLVRGCARPTHIFGHPKALEAIKKGYLSLGATGGTQPIMQVMITKDGNQLVPGFVLADLIDTSIGRIILIPDFRFTTIQVQPDRFSSTVYPLRVYHNGEPIVYKSTQTPLSFKDLSPGCTAISFMIYTVSSLVMKHMCAQAAYTSNFPGVTGTNCEVVGE